MVFLEHKTEWEECFSLLLDPDVSEIQANGPDSFFMKKAGKRQKIDAIRLADNDRYLEGIEQGLIPHVRTFNEWDRNGYIFEGPLEFKHGSTVIKGRTHIILPPASDTAQITIAKKSSSLATLDDIANKGTMSLEMKKFLEYAVQARLCVVFSGSTGSGKTTMLEAITKLIPIDTRIGVAEDTPELNLLQPNVTYLHSVPWAPGVDPNKVASLDWCVAQFNRMRTDMLIVGETRGKEFSSFLTAANSGMEGCMTTIHGNSPVRALDKMTNFALKGSDGQPIRAVNSDIGNAVDLIVQLTILPDGRHRVDALQEVTSVVSNSEDAKLTTNALYKYDYRSDKFVKENFPTDELRSRFAARGIMIDKALTGSIGESQEPCSSSKVAVIPPLQRGLPTQRREI
jgi:pilus assembly protein CpaF